MNYQKKLALIVLVVMIMVFLLLPAISFGGTIIPPSWYQKLSANKRFSVVLNGAAVLDKETGLVWEKNPSSDTQTWLYGFDNCYTRNVGGRKGWRLPSIEELNSLVDTTTINPALPSGHPFGNIQLSLYWTVNINLKNNQQVWYVDFASGNSGTDFKTSSRFIWCVRGGHGFDNIQ
jgi:hypothetical protein